MRTRTKGAQCRCEQWYGPRFCAAHDHPAREFVNLSRALTVSIFLCIVADAALGEPGTSVHGAEFSRVTLQAASQRDSLSPNSRPSAVDAYGRPVRFGAQGNSPTQRFGRDSVYAQSSHQSLQGVPAKQTAPTTPARNTIKPVARAAQPQVLPNGEARPVRTVMSSTNRQWIAKLDGMRERLATTQSAERQVIASITVGTAAVSTGYLLWLVRGGMLLASVLSSLPAWHALDPLPILARAKRDRKNKPGHPDSVEQLFRRQRCAKP